MFCEVQHAVFSINLLVQQLIGTLSITCKRNYKLAKTKCGDLRLGLFGQKENKQTEKTKIKRRIMEKPPNGISPKIAAFQKGLERHSEC